MSFRKIDLSELQNFNSFEKIGKEWMLITAGDKEKFNTMTASWGNLGVLWNKNISTIFVRPQRYTFEFLEKHDYYSLSFFDSKYKKALKFCGAHSGRNTDKSKEASLEPVFEDSESPYFEQSKVVLICKKIYAQFIDPKGFLDKSLECNYEKQDYHKMYVGEIIKCLVKD